jgi:hypothetical protein
MRSFSIRLFVLLIAAFWLPAQGAAMAVGFACPHELSSTASAHDAEYVPMPHAIREAGHQHNGTQGEECALCNLCAICTAAYMPATPAVARDTDFHPAVLPDFKASFVSFISASFYRPPVIFLA